MEQETPTTSPSATQLGEMQAQADALALYIGRLVLEGIAKDHMIARLQARVVELGKSHE